MSNFDHEQRLSVHVALNNCLVISDVMGECLTSGRMWKPLLLFIPLRLGIHDINVTYFEPLKKCFELVQCAGVIGGRPDLGKLLFKRN